MAGDLLLEKFNEYKTVVGYTMRYEFVDGGEVSYTFHKKNFPHLIGLQKLIDIPIINDFNDPSKQKISAGFLISRIKKGRFLNENIVRSSTHFYEIQERFDNFSRDNLLTVSYTDAVIDFNALKIGSVLKSNYILFENKGKGFDHLGIAVDKLGRTYVETFFYNPTDLYIKNQKIVKIKKVQIFDDMGNLYFEDNFI